MLWSLLLLGHVAVLVASRAAYHGAVQPESWPSVSNTLARDWQSDSDPEPGDTDVAETSKRTLSMLGRWRPFTSFMSRYVQPRSPSLGGLPDSTDFVSAETRGAIRPYGQPLRWGRR